MNVLICDDSKTDTEELTDILSYSYGSAMKVTAFCTASDTRSYICGNKAVDICFLELAIRETNGIELARALRADGYGGGIVFVSRERDFGPETYDVNALDYLLKPLMPEDVRNAVNNRRNSK